MQDWSDEAFAGYFAGMIDGEGCIELIGAFSVRIRIANTVLPTLEAMQNRLGFGKIIKYKRQKAEWRKLYVLEFSNSADVGAAFALCGQYIHIKREKMIVAQKILDRIKIDMARIDQRNIDIMNAVNAGELEQKEIARQFGVSPQTVSRLKLGHRWPSVLAQRDSKIGGKKFPRESDQVFRLNGDK